MSDCTVIKMNIIHSLNEDLLTPLTSLNRSNHHKIIMLSLALLELGTHMRDR